MDRRMDGFCVNCLLPIADCFRNQWLYLPHLPRCVCTSCPRQQGNTPPSRTKRRSDSAWDLSPFLSISIPSSTYRVNHRLRLKTSLQNKRIKRWHEQQQRSGKSGSAARMEGNWHILAVAACPNVGCMATAYFRRTRTENTGKYSKQPDD
jgi:hypothetical protein